MKDPRKLLDGIIALIERDITEIKKIPGRIDPDGSLALVRYSKALLDMIGDKEEVEEKIIEKEKDELDKITPEELKALAAKILANRQKNSDG